MKNFKWVAVRGIPAEWKLSEFGLLIRRHNGLFSKLGCEISGDSCLETLLKGPELEQDTDAGTDIDTDMDIDMDPWTRTWAWTWT